MRSRSARASIAGAVRVRPAGGDVLRRSGSGRSTRVPASGRPPRRARCGPAPNRWSRRPGARCPGKPSSEASSHSTSVFRSPIPPSPSSASGSGARRVHSTIPSGVGSPDATPSVNGSPAGAAAADPANPVRRVPGTASTAEAVRPAFSTPRRLKLEPRTDVVGGTSVVTASSVDHPFVRRMAPTAPAGEREARFARSVRLRPIYSCPPNFGSGAAVRARGRAGSGRRPPAFSAITRP